MIIQYNQEKTTLEGLKKQSKSAENQFSRIINRSYKQALTLFPRVSSKLDKNTQAWLREG